MNFYNIIISYYNNYNKYIFISRKMNSLKCFLYITNDNE